MKADLTTNVARLSELDLLGVVAAAARLAGTTPAEILGARKTKRIADGRRVAALGLRMLGRDGRAGAALSFPEIGELLGGRHHTTVMSILKKADGGDVRRAERAIASIARRPDELRVGVSEPEGRELW